MPHSHILYCGDTSLDTAASYLAGLMTAWGWDFTYIPSGQKLTESAIPHDCGLFIFSDYPAEQINAALQETIVERVSAGAGLLMLGGWESYQGLGGNWAETPIASAFPVTIASTDDRRNCDQPVFVRPTTLSHAVNRGLPWSSRPPLIGGFNAFTAKEGSQTLLEANLFDATFDGDIPKLQEKSKEPLLVVSSHGSGRTAALATDVAPHWIGPMVDWGTERVTACAAGAEEVEVGNLYDAFFRNLLSWTAKLD